MRVCVCVFLTGSVHFSLLLCVRVHFCSCFLCKSSTAIIGSNLPRQFWPFSCRRFYCLC